MRHMGCIKAQIILEYGLLVLVVAAVFASMGLYARRAVSANLKIMQDQLNQSPQ